MPHPTSPRLGQALVAALAVITPTLALAFNPETIFVSPEAALGGGAVLATDDPSGAGWYNPASLGGLRRSSLQLGASAYSVSAYRVRDALVTELPWETSSGAASDTSYGSVPAVLAYSYHLADGLGLALGIWTTYHGSQSASLGNRSTGPYPGRPDLSVTYQQHYSYTTAADDTWVGAAAGWQVTPRLRLGAALQGAYSTSTLVLDLDTSLETTSALPLERGSHVNVSYRSNESMVAGRGILGLQWDVVEALRLAVALRSPSVRVLAWGNTTRLLAVSVMLPGYAPQQGQVVSEVAPSSGLSIVDVGRISAGLAWEPAPWSVRLDGEWSPALDRATAGAKPSWNARLGVLYQLTGDTVLGAGAFREGARAKASQGDLEIDQYGLTGGVSFRPAKVLGTPGGGKSWDLLTGVAGRIAYGTGHGPGMVIRPFDLGSSQLPVLFGRENGDFLEVPARRFDASLHVFTSLAF